MDKPELTEVVNAQMPLGKTLGIRTFGSPDEVDATLEWAPELCTAAGALHGGVLMSLADSAGGVCAFLNLPPGATTVTIESKTNFLGASGGNGARRARDRCTSERRRSSSRPTSSTPPAVAWPHDADAGGSGGLEPDGAILCRRGGGSSVGRAPGCGPGGRGFESRPPPLALDRRTLPADERRSRWQIPV